MTGDGPTTRLADELRALHERRGFNQLDLAKKIQVSPKTISMALKGAHRPTWKVTLQILAACNVDEADVPDWKVKWDAAEQAHTTVRALLPADTAEMVGALHELMRRSGRTVEHLRELTTTIRPPQINEEPPWWPPRPETITAALADGGKRPPCRHLVMLVLAACGSSYQDMMPWLRQVAEAAPCDCAAPPAESPRAMSRARRSLAALGAVVAVSVTLLWVNQRETATERSAPPSASPKPPAPRTAGPARGPLAELAARTALLPNPTGGGPVVYVHTSVLRRDDTSDAAEPFTTHSEQLWRSADGSGMLRTAPQPADGRQPTSVRTLSPGEIPAAVGELSADPGLLAERMHRLDPGIGSAADALRTVGTLYRYHCPGSAERAALLRVLADTAGLVALTDDQARSVRERLQISASEKGGTIEHRAVFDSGTGALLGIETIHHPDPRERLRAETVTEATTYLSCRRLDSIG